MCTRYREYASLLNIHDVDAYIRYGGSFRMGETAFEDDELSDESVSFRDDESTRRYIDTAIAKNRAFKLMFDVGEIDVVIADREKLTCKLYEIKHSTKIDSRKYRYLIDKSKCSMIEHRYGHIEERTVLYRGPETFVDGVLYKKM